MAEDCAICDHEDCGEVCLACYRRMVAERDKLQAEVDRLNEMVIGNAKTFNAENACLMQLLACKDEALGVFASNRMWGPVDLLGVFQWMGAGPYADPMAFAARERDRVFPNDSIGSVTHTMPEPGKDGK